MMYFSRTRKSRSQALVILFSLLLFTYVWLSGPIRRHACHLLTSYTQWTTPDSLHRHAARPLESFFCRPGGAGHETRPRARDLFYHLGGNGPWIPKIEGVVRGGPEVPRACAVEQVHMLSRHAERYPTKNAGARHIALLDRLSAHGPLHGSLSFLHNWTYFTNLTNPSFEDLTTTGPYAGTSEALTTGTKLRARYDHLIDANRPTNFWTCSSPRDVETAQCFAAGFFGADWSSSGAATLHIIPESSDRGGDTLTPGHTCLTYQDDKAFGHDYGYHRLAIWQERFSHPISTRLQAENPTLSPPFTPLEIYGMMEMCGFEILVRGDSPWCPVFTTAEWDDFEYARDLLHFYRAGPGNRYAGVMGWLWLNATLDLIQNEDAASGVYFSFVHDGDVVPVLAALGVLSGDGFPDKGGHDQSSGNVDLDQDDHAGWEKHHLPADHRKDNRHWRTSDVVPMGGRIIFEKLNCRSDADADAESQSQQGALRNETFIRLLVNDGVIGTTVGDSGGGAEGRGWRLGAFAELVRRRGREVGDFREVCGLDGDAPSRITFLHQ